MEEIGGSESSAERDHVQRLSVGLGVVASGQFVDDGSGEGVVQITAAGDWRRIGVNESDGFAPAFGRCGIDELSDGGGFVGG